MCQQAEIVTVQTLCSASKSLDVHPRDWNVDNADDVGGTEGAFLHLDD